MFNKTIKYLRFLLPTSIVVMLLWTIFIDGTLFYCSDKVPFLDFIPPFVHEESPYDYYIVDEKVVWVIWFIFIGLIFFFPYIIAKKFRLFKTG